MKALLCLPLLFLVSCGTIRETTMINAPQERVRESIASECLSQGGIITDDTRYTVKAEIPNPNGVDRFLNGREFQEWVFNVSGSLPTRLTLMPFMRVGYSMSGVNSIDDKTSKAVRDALASIKRRAERG